MKYKQEKAKWNSYLKQIKENKKYIKKYGKEQFIMAKYKEMGFEEFDIHNPKKYNEKLQARRLNRNQLMEICADKNQAREYVKEKIGEKYLVPQLFCKKKVTKKDIENLPNSFILKISNGSGNNILVKDKSRENINDIVKLINFYTKIEYGYIWGEFHYNNMPINIVAEELLLDENNMVPNDIKIHCFNNGKEKRKIIDCHYEQNGVHYKNMYDENWKTLDYVYGFKSAGKKIEKPKKFDEIIKICDKLSEDTNYVRVDLYCVNDKIYFGELTFIPGAGYAKFEPESADLLWGEYMGNELK